MGQPAPATPVPLAHPIPRPLLSTPRRGRGIPSVSHRRSAPPTSPPRYYSRVYRAGSTPLQQPCFLALDPTAAVVAAAAPLRSAPRTTAEAPPPKHLCFTSRLYAGLVVFLEYWFTSPGCHTFSPCRELPSPARVVQVTKGESGPLLRAAVLLTELSPSRPHTAHFPHLRDLHQLRHVVCHKIPSPPSLCRTLHGDGDTGKRSLQQHCALSRTCSGKGEAPEALA